jgi:hypothetical protein
MGNEGSIICDCFNLIKTLVTTTQFTVTIKFTLQKYIGNKKEIFPCDAARMKLQSLNRIAALFSAQTASSMNFDCPMTATCTVATMGMK